MFFFPFIKIYFHNTPKQFFIFKIFRGYDFGIYNIAIFDEYFEILGSDLLASIPACLTIECPPWGKHEI